MGITPTKSGCGPVALALAAIVWLAPASAAAQQRTAEEAVREAGRLCTEAERLQGEAMAKVDAGGDLKLLDDANRASIERFRRAVDLWHQAGAREREAKGLEELARLYLCLREPGRAIETLERMVGLWPAASDPLRRVGALQTLALRLEQAKRHDEALARINEAVELSRAAGQARAESARLYQGARLYEVMGRAGEAAAYQARSEALERAADAARAEAQEAPEPVQAPAAWYDLPSAPLAAEYRTEDGVVRAVLVNRSTKGVEGVMFGCAADVDGKVHVARKLGGMGRNHGGVRPGDYFDPFERLNGPLNEWTDEKMGCEAGGRMVVVEVTYDDGSTWSAEGASWSQP
jgi:tetratricopeptide (TPR) repeat protein